MALVYLAPAGQSASRAASRAAEKGQGSGSSDEVRIWTKMQEACSLQWQDNAFEATAFYKQAKLRSILA